MVWNKSTIFVSSILPTGHFARQWIVPSVPAGVCVCGRGGQGVYVWGVGGELWQVTIPNMGCKGCYLDCFFNWYPVTLSDMWLLVQDCFILLYCVHVIKGVSEKFRSLNKREGWTCSRVKKCVHWKWPVSMSVSSNGGQRVQQQCHQPGQTDQPRPGHNGAVHWPHVSLPCQWRVQLYQDERRLPTGGDSAGSVVLKDMITMIKLINDLVWICEKPAVKWGAAGKGAVLCQLPDTSPLSTIAAWYLPTVSHCCLIPPHCRPLLPDTSPLSVIAATSLCLPASCGQLDENSPLRNYGIV